MWADFYFRTKTKKEANKIDAFLENSKENKLLEKVWYPLFISCDKDLERAKTSTSPQYFKDYYTKEYWKWVRKASWHEYTEESQKILNTSEAQEKVFELVTIICEKLNKKFDMGYLKRSCAFNEQWFYFTKSQIKRITNNNLLLTQTNLW